MSYEFIVLKSAECDLDDAYNWYERQRIGLGDEFLASVDAAYERIFENPLQFAEVHRDVRQCLLRRFPYTVNFMFDTTRIVVLAVFHCSRDPSIWQRRI